MNNDRILAELKRQRYRTNHVLHFFISLFTVGLWIPVWALVTISNNIGRAKVDYNIAKAEAPDQISTGSILYITVALFAAVLAILMLLGVL